MGGFCLGDFCLRASLVGLATVGIGGCLGQRSSSVQVPPSPSVTATEQPTLASPSVSASMPQPETNSETSPSASSTSSPGATQSPSLFGKIKQDLKVKVAIAKQDTGKTYLGNVLMSQQAEKLVKGRFNADLKRLSADIPLDTDEYRLEVRQADETQAIIVAIAKKPGFASYTGAVYSMEGKIPMTSICKTNVPSQTPPPPPQIVSTGASKGLMCATGSSTVN
jgi:Type IV pilin-like G and H, putative